MEKPPEIPPDLRAAFQACRPDFIRAFLIEIGIAPQELTADINQVAPAIRKAIGKKYWGQFGLCGGYGIGKTFAIVALLREYAAESVDRLMVKMCVIPEATDNPYDPQPYQAIRTIRFAVEAKKLNVSTWPLWCNWPGEVAANRAKLYQREQQGEVEHWILGLEDPSRLVILDDIGADRLTAQDWTGEVLARIIDARLRNQGPIIWTSNLNGEGLVKRYGARTFSRLQALAPMIELPPMPDLRLRGMAS